MLETIKKQFLQLIQSLGYHCTDNGRYEDSFPWLMLRTSRRQCSFSRDIRFDTIMLSLDIFSTYTGEKEIQDIAENIIDNLPTLQSNNADITFVSLNDMKIMDDPTHGPVRKHGVLSFTFVLTSGLNEEEENETTNQTGN